MSHDSDGDRWHITVVFGSNDEIKTPNPKLLKHLNHKQLDEVSICERFQQLPEGRLKPGSSDESAALGLELPLRWKSQMDKQ